MKKRIWGLLAGIALAAAFCAALVYLLGDAKEEEGLGQQTGGNVTTILQDVEEKELESVRVTGADGELYACKNEDEELEIPALFGMPVDLDKLEELVRYSCLIRGQEKLPDAAENLPEYGLDEASCTTVEITYTQETISFQIGSKVPGSSNGSRYVLYDGAVYTMYELHLEPFLNRVEYFISEELTPSNENGEYVLLYFSMQKENEEPLTVAYHGAEETVNGQYMATYQIISPAEYALTYSERGTDFLQSAFGMKAKAEKLHPSKEELEACGLDSPKLVVQIAYMSREGEDFGLQLSLSEPDEEGYAWLMIQGLEVIYRFALEEALWYGITLEEVVGRQILLPSIKNVSAVTMETADTAWSVTLAVNAEGELEASRDGEACSVDEFKKLYQVLISAEVDTLYSGELPEDAGLLLRVTYAYLDGTSDTVAFYEGPPRQAYVLLNEDMYGQIRRTYVDTSLDALSSFLNGEEIVIRY